METISKNERYKALDSLRGIAALMIVLFHFTMLKPQSEYGFKLMTTGVDLFFIISGFVIFLSINNANNLKEFIKNRVIKLFPTYWTAATFTFILILSSTFILNKNIDINNVKQFIGNLTMIQFYLKIPDLDGPYWTLLIELSFYISLCILYQTNLLKHINTIGLILLIALLVTSFYIDQFEILKRIITRIPLLQFIPLFFAGILFYKIYTLKNKILETYGLIVACLINQIILYKHAGWSWYYINQVEYAIMLSLYFIIFGLFVNNKLNFIANNVTLFLGKISYALYLSHYYLSDKILLPYFTQTLKINFWVSSIILTLPIVLFIAYFITFYIEIPIREKFKQKKEIE